jgi:hypothetical protein
MRVAVTMLSQTGGHGDAFMPCGVSAPLLAIPGRPAASSTVSTRCAGALARSSERGADVLTVCSSDDDPRHAQFQLDESAALAAEAEAVHLPVMAQAQSTQGIKNAVTAGFRSIEHGIYLDDEAVELMLARGTSLVPTLLAPSGVVMAAETECAVPEESVRQARGVMEDHEASFPSRRVGGGSYSDGHRRRCRPARKQPRRGRPHEHAWHVACSRTSQRDERSG